MKAKLDDEIDEPTRRYLAHMHSSFVERVFGGHRLPVDQQMTSVTEWLHWIRQNGILRPQAQRTNSPIVDLMAKQCASDVLIAIDANDLASAVLSALRIGHLVGSTYYGSDYSIKQIAAKVIAGGRKGAKRSHQNSAELANRNKQIRAFVQEQVTKNADLPRKSALVKAATRFRLKFETVKKIAKNPGPNRQKRVVKCH